MKKEPIYEILKKDEILVIEREGDTILYATNHYRELEIKKATVPEKKK